ncbi:MAG: M10 family metallopeptidase C-terminal domain-containing protein, partial [Pseudomonadota bacterium]
ARTSTVAGIITSVDVNVSTDWLANFGTTLDSYSFQTYIHEIGHALGLRHPGPYNGDGSYDDDAVFLNDSWATTVMSYFSQTENSFFEGLGFDRLFTLTPMSGDIVAAQISYGGSTGTRTDNTTYGVGNDSGRAVYGISDATTNNAGNLLAFVIVDDGGSDTVDYSAFSSDQLINLNQETFSNVGGSTGNMSIARGTVIENAVAGSGNDTLIGNDTGNVLTGGLGDDTIDGGSNVDVAVFSGNMADYTITQTALGVFVVEGADGTDTLTNVEFLQFDDQNMRLLRGTGVSVDFDTGDASDYQAAMDNILDFDGNALGGNGSWVHIGSIDINGDGDVDEILVNAAIGRFATVGFADDGLVYFDDHSWSGETRVVGIYIDPLVESGEVEAGSDLDSQRRFQNDLQIGNISTVLSADDFDGDGVWEVYFALTDGTAFLRALMHADGNIRYANYQSEAQVIEYLTANGYGEETYGDWFGDNAAQPGAEVITFVNEGITQKDDANGADASDASTTDIPDASGRVGPVSMAAIDAPLPGELTISDLIDLAQQMEGPDPIGPIDTLVPVLDPMHLEFFG